MRIRLIRVFDEADQQRGARFAGVICYGKFESCAGSSPEFVPQHGIQEQCGGQALLAVNEFPAVVSPSRLCREIRLQIPTDNDHLQEIVFVLFVLRRLVLCKSFEILKQKPGVFFCPAIAALVGFDAKPSFQFSKGFEIVFPVDCVVHGSFLASWGWFHGKIYQPAHPDERAFQLRKPIFRSFRSSFAVCSRRSSSSSSRCCVSPGRSSQCLERTA